nr:MAG TPA: hypothetical protein [Caudoviricetes sp.]
MHNVKYTIYFIRFPPYRFLNLLSCEIVVELSLALRITLVLSKA